jgi:hypothetical protein
MRENEGCDDGRAVCGEGDVFRVEIVHPARECEVIGFEWNFGHGEYTFDEERVK